MIPYLLTLKFKRAIRDSLWNFSFRKKICRKGKERGKKETREQMQYWKERKGGWNMCTMLTTKTVNSRGYGWLF